MLAQLRSLLCFVLALWAVLLLYHTVLPPFSTLMAARVFSFKSVQRQYVPLKRISPHLIRSVIAAEDGRFCDHHGVDWKAMHSVARDVLEDDTSHGASTITMQTAKNLFLWMGYSYLRKPIEVPMAIVIDGIWSKRLIMENYLNVAEFGKGIFGAEAAARHYFRKSARHLSAREAALLAAVLPSPKRRNASRPSPFVSRYAASIQARAGGVDASCVLRR